MKYKTTRKAVLSGYSVTVCVPYCAAQTLLNYGAREVAYTVRREGWAADVFELSDNIAIITGYAPFGKIRPDYETVKAYEKAAREVVENTSDYEKRKSIIKALLAAFVAEARRIAMTK